MGVKGGMLRDDAEWSATGVKEGAKLMMMGTADAPPEAPKEAVVFLEDMPSSGGGAGGAGGTSAAGLENLGNTCYMNATVQCLFQVPELRQALDGMGERGGGGGSSEASTRLALATRETFSSLAAAARAGGGDAVTPSLLLAAMRARFPQFAQAGPGGVPAQQDAEECWSQLLFVLKECLKEGAAAGAAAGGGPGSAAAAAAAAAVGAEEGGAAATRRPFASAIDRLFGVRTRAVLTCEATGESVTVDGDGSVAASGGGGGGGSGSGSSASALALKCNITSEVNHLAEGIALGLAEDREMASAKLGGSLALFKGSSKITRLPPYLTTQLVRFFYKTDVGQKAKVLRKVSFPMTLDVHDWCSDELKKALEGPRAAASATAAAAAVKGRAGGGGGGGEEEKKGEEGEKKEGTSGDVKMEEPEAAAAPSSSSVSSSGRLTGRYDLVAVLTHKGRSADSGHYVAWARDETDQAKKRWLQYDDDDVIERTGEEVLALSGGGDWHMAYLLLYKAELAP